MKLRLGVDNVRRLWWLAMSPGKHDGLSSKVQMMSDGEKNMWDSSNCHLEETCLKEHYASTQQEQEYLLKIRLFDSPFYTCTKEKKYSVEQGCLTVGEVDI